MKYVADIIEHTSRLHRQVESTTSSIKRKQKGQFFTPLSVCEYMASWFSQSEREYRLLDPGAGVGALTAAFCREFSRSKTPRSLEVHLFENDSKIIELLAENMNHCKRTLESSGHSMKYYIHVEDFVLKASEQFGQYRSLFDERDDLGIFHGVITNPPYFKIRKENKYASIPADLPRGQSNIYFLFLALSAQLLCAGGELVAITPRSFCNGLYFRDFRKWFLERMSLERIHIFESRTASFSDTGVLQETIISLSRKSSRQAPSVDIAASSGFELSEYPPFFKAARDQVIDQTSGDSIIRIPMHDDDIQVMNVVESLPLRFKETGLRVSTGPVVLFRTSEYLLDEMNGNDAVPLILPLNLKPYKTVWPAKKGNKPVAFLLCDKSRKYCLPIKNYVLLKRFTAKEERRRLLAGCFFSSNQRGRFIALENHVNYIYHENRELTESETLGIASVFNSILYDKYFRILSGNTQVNANEIRTMKFPDLELLSEIGRRAGKTELKSEEGVEKIVLEMLGVSNSIHDRLMECVQ
jgi:adenine-specific DNA-methyltransferase